MNSGTVVQDRTPLPAPPRDDQTDAEKDHLLEIGYESQYTRTLPSMTYLHDKLKARVIYGRDGEMVYAYCYGAIPVCYATSTNVDTSCRGAGSMPRPRPLRTPQDRRSMEMRRIDMTHLIRSYGKLRKMPDVLQSLEELYVCYSRPDWFNIAVHVANSCTHDVAVQAVQDYKTECASSKAGDPSQERRMFYADMEKSREQRFIDFRAAFGGDLALAFNFLLVSTGLRFGIMFHGVRYCNRPGVMARIIEEARKDPNIRYATSGVAGQEDMVLIFNLSKSASEESAFAPKENNIDGLIKMAFREPNGAIYGQLNDHLCPSQTSGGNCLVYTIGEQEPDGKPPSNKGRVVFYFETCVSIVRESDHNRREVKWKALGKQVEMRVAKCEVSLLMNYDFRKAIVDCDVITLFDHRCSIARRFWGDEFWDLTGYMFLQRVVSPEDMERMCKEYHLVWQFIVLLMESDLLRRPGMYVSDARRLRRMLGRFECQLYTALKRPYSVSRIDDKIPAMREIGFERLPPMLEEGQYVRLDVRGRALMTMLADLAIVLDKYMRLTQQSPDHIRRLVRKFEEAILNRFHLRNFVGGD